MTTKEFFTNSEELKQMMSAARATITAPFFGNNVEEIKPVLEEYSQKEEVARLKVAKKDFKDGVKLYVEDGTTWILVRPSGTEPLLRIYMESDSLDKIEKIKAML